MIAHCMSVFIINNNMFILNVKLFVYFNFGSVSDLLVFISDFARFNEVKSLNVRLRIPSVIKIAFL